ncbi:MAG: hypothetical protein HeimC2_39520 [Candidatus Heimdallarchaeota archaeon LC_2]|nr:MAG: hypothetical protein HeimC2_39520 [Candidatus Heimdallarchaeota archaeon LC_2]
MTSVEEPIFPTFICDAGDSTSSFTKIEATLYSDHIFLKGITYDFENSIPLSKINKVIYRNWHEELGLLFFKIVIPLSTFMSILSYSMVQDISVSLLTLLMIIITIHIIRLGELNIIINNECLSLVGNKETLRYFWGHLESSLSILENN